MASSSRHVDLDFEDNDFDVVIVGSGLAGLVAAYSILNRRIGLSVLILESNDTIGGRILLEKNSQAFHGNFRQGHIVKLVNELKILTEPGSDTGGKRLIFFTRNGPLPKGISSLVSGQVYHFLKLFPTETAPKALKRLVRVEKEFKKTEHRQTLRNQNQGIFPLEVISIDPRFGNYAAHEDSDKLAETSVKKLVQKRVYLPQAQLICRSLLRACCGVENLENVSALWFIVMLHGAGGLFRKLSASLGDDQRFFLKGGFVHLAKELEKQIIDEGGTVKCSETVVEVAMNGDTVYVSTRTKRFKCDYVVIAVPPAASSRIAVEPALPEFLQKSQGLYEPAENVFFYATYREPFWTENLSGSMIGTEDSGSSLRMTYDATHPPGQQVRVLAGLLSAAVDSSPRNSVFGALKKCFQTRKASRCISYSVGSWSSDGADSSMYAMRPSSIRYHVNPMLVPLQRIFFAASEYATSWPGTADGAIESGEKVACSIIFRARPQALDRAQIIACGVPKGQSERTPESSSGSTGIARAHLICLGMNVFLFFFLLRDAYETN